MRPFIALALITIASQTANADIDTIIPLPKEVQSVRGPVPLAGFQIVADGSGHARIGADEINLRIGSLGGKPLPVLDLTRPLPEGNQILLASCTAVGAELARHGLRVTPSDPGRQGYAITPAGAAPNLKLFLIGSDTLGTLYAAATCRQLIVKRGGRLMLLPAEIRDWPDYKYRQNGMAFAETLRGRWYSILSEERKGNLEKAQKLATDFVARQKRYFGWMLRAKINFAWNSTNIKPGDAPEQTTVVRAALKEVHEYGLARGIESMCGDTTAIGSYPRDKDNPDFKGVVRHRSHNRYFCWSQLGYHRQRAERAAKWLDEAGYTGYYLHATDGGGWQNPELWNDRCPLCRETYGDDRAKADAVVFRIYYDAIKKRIPDLKFVAVVYPYSGRYLDPEYVYSQAAATMGVGEPARRLAERTSQKITQFIERLNRLLPEDVFVCIREAERRHMELIRKSWGKRRFQLYYEYAFWKGWRPYFVTTPLWTKTHYFPEYDDILFSPLGAWSEVTQLMGVECSWHTNRPGSGEMDKQRWIQIGTAVPPPPERKTFALRACRYLFGDEAGPLVAPVFAENISHTFITRPDEVLKRLDVDDPTKVMSGQAQATARAAASLDRLWDLQQKSPVLAGDAYGYFLNFYLMTHGAQVLAAHRAHMRSAQDAIARADRSGLEKALAAVRNHLEQAGPRWAGIWKKVPRDKLFCTYLRKKASRGMLSLFDVLELQKEADDLWGRREQLIAARTIPKWFERRCRSREVVAVPAEGAVTVDGRLDEPAWQDAWPIEHFIDHRMLRLEALETRARLACDSDALYVAFECLDPNPGEITATLPDRDEHQLCDSVEVLVAASGKSREFVQWIVDSQGTVFDARATMGDDGRVVYSRRWNGTATVAASRQADRWTVEMAVPRADLPTQPRAGKGCRVLLCRNIVHTRAEGEEEQNAIVFLDGSGFRTVEKFAQLRFAEADEKKPTPEVGLVLRPMIFKHVTTGDGSGTTVGGDLRIETDAYLHDVRLTGKFTDGVESLGQKELGSAQLVQLLWRPDKPFFVLFPTEAPGVVATFKVAAREGEWTFVRRFGSPKRRPIASDRLYASGVAGKALAAPAFLSSVDPKTIDLKEGTIEFWVRPNWDVTPRVSGPRGGLDHTFFNLGPIRPDYPYLSNRDSLTISHECYGNLTGLITNSHYEARSVAASIRHWRSGQWHHLAFQWKLDDGGRTSMSLFLDGKLASDVCRGSARHPNDRPLKTKALGLPIQIGSMNTGYRPADASMDELRISSPRRYSTTFAPDRRPNADRHTLALFHFDGSLQAEVPAGALCTAGPAQ